MAVDAANDADKPRWTIEWRRDGDDVLVATEPTDEELQAASTQLAAYYNDAHNRRMLAHEAALSPDDVVACYARLRAEGGRPLLLSRAGVLMGDADVRHIERTTGANGTGEVAILIGARAAQGRGLGTRYALMLHAFAFQILGLDRAYVSVIPANIASRRLFEKLGYAIDDTPAARALIDDETDVTLSVDRARFELRWRDELAALRIYERARR